MLPDSAQRFKLPAPDPEQPESARKGAPHRQANKLAGRLAALFNHPLSHRAFNGFQCEAETYLREAVDTDLELSAIL